jgi:hypothetical protein
VTKTWRSSLRVMGCVLGGAIIVMATGQPSSGLLAAILEAMYSCARLGRSLTL